MNATLLTTYLFSRESVYFYDTFGALLQTVFYNIIGVQDQSSQVLENSWTYLYHILYLTIEIYQVYFIRNEFANNGVKNLHKNAILFIVDFKL